MVSASEAHGVSVLARNGYVMHAPAYAALEWAPGKKGRVLPLASSPTSFQVLPPNLSDQPPALLKLVRHIRQDK